MTDATATTDDELPLFPTSAPAVFCDPDEDEDDVDDPARLGIGLPPLL